MTHLIDFDNVILGAIVGEDGDAQARLRAELEDATAELKAHMASWEYAFAMGSGRDGARDHPVHWETNARTETLLDRCRSLRARLAEYET